MGYQCDTGDGNAAIVVVQQLTGDVETVAWCEHCWPTFIATAYQAMFAADEPVGEPADPDQDGAGGDDTEPGQPDGGDTGTETAPGTGGDGTADQEPASPDGGDAGGAPPAPAETPAPADTATAAVPV